MKLEPFSYSRLTSFETCPKKFHAISIAKTVKDPPNEHTTYGTQLHDAFAGFLRDGKKLPLHLGQHKPYLDRLKAAPGEHIIEQKLAVNADFQGTDWMARDVYLRVISDVTIMNGSKALIWDHKSGKMYDDFTQLKLTGVVMFMLAEELEEIKLAYFWTKERKVTQDNIVRADVPEIWAGFVPRVQRYQSAFDAQEFPAKPGIHCKWCPVSKCPYWERRK